MSAPEEHTAGCWRPDAVVHCCGLRNPDGSWRVPGLESTAAMNTREQMFWNAALVRAQDEVKRLRYELRLVTGERDKFSGAVDVMHAQQIRTENERDAAQIETERLRCLIDRILDYSAFTHAQQIQYRAEAGITTGGAS